MRRARRKRRAAANAARSHPALSEGRPDPGHLSEIRTNAGQAFSGSGRYRGQLVGPDSGSVFLRLAQHARHADPRLRLDFARHLVAEKCRAGRALLRRYARNHPEVTAEMDRAAMHLDGALDRLAGVDSEDMLRGVEGAAAAAYFTAFDRMIRPPTVFERRSRHPATTSSTRS